MTRLDIRFRTPSALQGKAAEARRLAKAHDAQSTALRFDGSVANAVTNKHLQFSAVLGAEWSGLRVKAFDLTVRRLTTHHAST